METGMGFAITHNGAIGFSRDVEDRMMLSAAMGGSAPSTGSGAGYQMQNQQQQNQHQKDSNGGGSTSLKSAIKSNRDAFSKMHIVCESVMPENGNGAGVTSTRARTHDGERRAAFSKSSARPMSAARPKVSTSYLPSEDDEEVHLGLSMHDYESDEEELHLGAGSFGMGGFDLGDGDGIMTGAKQGEVMKAARLVSENHSKPQFRDIMDEFLLKTLMVTSYKENVNPRTDTTATTGKERSKVNVIDIFAAMECANILARPPRRNANSAVGPVSADASSTPSDEQRAEYARSLQTAVQKAYDCWTNNFVPLWNASFEQKLVKRTKGLAESIGKMEPSSVKTALETQWKKCMKSYGDATEKAQDIAKGWLEFSEKMPTWKQALQRILERQIDARKKAKKPITVTILNESSITKKIKKNGGQAANSGGGSGKRGKGQPANHGGAKIYNITHNHTHHHADGTATTNTSHSQNKHGNTQHMPAPTQMHGGANFPEMDYMSTGVCMDEHQSSSNSYSLHEDRGEEEEMYCQCEHPEPVDMATGVKMRASDPSFLRNTLGSVYNAALKPRPNTKGGKKGGIATNYAQQHPGGYAPKTPVVIPPGQPRSFIPNRAGTYRRDLATKNGPGVPGTVQPGAHAPQYMGFQQPMMYIPATSAPMQGMVPVQYMYQ
jgi:hypothetical protein